MDVQYEIVFIAPTELTTVGCGVTVSVTKDIQDTAQVSCVHNESRVAQHVAVLTCSAEIK